MNDEIIVLRKSELRSVVAESVKAVVEDKFDALKGFIENLALKKDLPRWIKGDKAAAELLGISAQALRLRRKNGYLREGLRFSLSELGDWVVVGNIYENPELLQ